MKIHRTLLAATIAAGSILGSSAAWSATEIQWWHAMGGRLGEVVEEITKQFNASQSDYKLISTFKGGYEDTMTAGIETAGRGSIAARIIVCVPPPLAPVTARRLPSTSGSVSKKSSERIEFQVCRPMTFCRFASACGLKSPQFSSLFISSRCLAKRWAT